MRPEDYLIHLSPPISSATTTTPSTVACYNHADCRWRPYTGAKDFEANAATILIILLCALICALALNTAIRCFFRRPPSQPVVLPQTQQDSNNILQQKNNANSAPILEALPTLVYSADMKTKIAGAEADCAICLSEFMEGEGIRVLGRCSHGFHTICIQEWLSSHSSCPTCRSSCFPPSPPPSLPLQQITDQHN